MASSTIAPVSSEPLALSLVVPTFNEAANVRSLLARLTALLDETLKNDYEIIVVDDDSPDRTAAVAQEFADVHPAVRVICRVGERGLATAVVHGWQHARGSVLGVMDADLQHPPEIAVKLWQEILRGADLAVGSRHTDGGGVSDWKISRRVLSRGAQVLGLTILPEVLGRVTDPMSGCFFVRRAAITGVTLRPIGYKILIEVIGRGSIRWISEVGYVFRERTDGATKVTARIYCQYVGHLFRLRLALLLQGALLRYCAVTFAGIGAGMALATALSAGYGSALPLVSTSLISAEVALLGMYAAHESWTFRRRIIGRSNLFYRIVRFLKFSMITHSSMALVFAIDRLAVVSLRVDNFTVLAALVPPATVWSFWLSDHVTWQGPVLDQGFTTKAPIQSQAAVILATAGRGTR